MNGRERSSVLAASLAIAILASACTGTVSTETAPPTSSTTDAAGLVSEGRADPVDFMETLLTEGETDWQAGVGRLTTRPSRVILCEPVSEAEQAAELFVSWITHEVVLTRPRQMQIQMVGVAPEGADAAELVEQTAKMSCLADFERFAVTDLDARLMEGLPGAVTAASSWTLTTDIGTSIVVHLAFENGMVMVFSHGGGVSASLADLEPNLSRAIAKVAAVPHDD